MATTPLVTAANTEERNVLMSAMLPESLITWYQEQRRGLGMKAASGATVYGIAAAFYIVGVFLFTLVWNFMGTIYTKLKNNRLIRLLFILIVAFFLFYTVYFLYIRPKSDKPYFAAARDDVVGFFEGFQNAPQDLDTEEAQQPLLNLQPMAMKQTGYIGPTEKGGAFDLDSGLRAAIKSGVRFFTLQIDYLDAKRDPKLFAPVGEPTLVYRDDRQGLISMNGLNLREVTQMFANYAFSEESVGSKFPLVLYLQFTRTPDAVKKPEAYLNFLSATAAALEPLGQFQLANSGEGAFGRQQNELALLRKPVRDLTRKVVFLANVDTSLFRRTAQLGMKEFEPSRDLDAMVHIRVYAETTDDIVGASVLAPGGEKVNAISVSLKRILAMSEKERAAFRDVSKSRFIIATPSQMANPSRKEFDMAYAMGINIVPLNPFGKDKDGLKAILKLWESGKFLKARPVALQTAATTMAANS